MEYLYYKAKCAESDALSDEVTKMLETAKAHRVSVADKWKPDGFGTMGDTFCLGFYEERPASEKWIKKVGTLHDTNLNKEYYLYRGHNSYKKGKELNADLSSEKCNPDWREYVAEKVGAVCWVMDAVSRRMWTQKVGFNDDNVLLICIPIGRDTEKAVEKLPKWLEKIKKSEFYALQGE